MVLHKSILLVAIVTPMIYQVHGRREHTLDKYIPMIPKACVNATICTHEDFEKENLTNFPLFDEMMKNYADNIRTLEYLKPIEYKLSEKQSDEGEDNCASEPPTPVTMRLVRDATYPNQTWNIVPYNSNYKQIVYMQKCKSRFSPCFDGFTIQGKAKAVCEQEYTTVMVQTLDEETKKSKTFNIDVPAHCSCKIEEYSPTTDYNYYFSDDDE